MAEARALLEVDDVTIRFGGLTALNGITFDIREGEILGLIGPNGAGKTTCFNVMTGVYQATSGQVRFDGTPLTKMKRHKITQLGIARTFQNIRLFKSMTVLENVMVGADAHSKVSFVDALFRTPRHRRTESASLERAKELCGHDVTSTEGREKLGLGLKAMRVLGIAAPVGPALEPGTEAGKVAPHQDDD